MQLEGAAERGLPVGSEAADALMSSSAKRGREDYREGSEEQGAKLRQRRG
jgi:hypothetical protein